MFSIKDWRFDRVIVMDGVVLCRTIIRWCNISWIIGCSGYRLLEFQHDLLK